MPIEKLRPTFSLIEERLRALEEVVPEVFADGRINWETLRELLGERLEDEDVAAEHFGLFWPGKREARRLAAQPSKGTLVPAPGEGVDEETTEHIFIEGDNLEVLKLLQKSYAGRIKMIYIDPPYNTGNDLIYRDDFAEPLEQYLKKTGQMAEEGELLTTNTKADGRFHTNWLNMLYPRLRLARHLLRDDGVIFISIDDNEVHNLRYIANEIFGEENFVATLIWQKSKKGDAKLIAQTHEYILITSKNKTSLIESGGWRRKKPGVDEVLEHYQKLRRLHKSDHNAISHAIREWYSSMPKDDPRRAHQHYRWSDDRGLYFAADFAGPDDGRDSRPRYEIIHPVTKRPCKKPSTGWRWEQERTHKALAEKPALIHFGADETTIPCRKSYLFAVDSEPMASVFYRDGRAATLELEALVGKGLLEFPKNTDVLKELIEITNCPDGIILDFFAGSGTTAHAVMELNKEDNGNRKYICVQLPEPLNGKNQERHRKYKTIADIAKERIRKAAGVIHKELASKLNLNGQRTDLGFKVFKLDGSNFRAWQDYHGESLKQLEGLFSTFETPLIDGWKEQDVLTEISILEGFPLNSKVAPAPEFTSNKVMQIESGLSAHRLFVCLEPRIEDNTIEQLAILSREDIFICLDSALDDAAKVRLNDVGNVRTI